MRDSRNVALSVGDTVVYSTYRSTELTSGIVVGFTNRAVRISIGEKPSAGLMRESIRYERY